MRLSVFVLALLIMACKPRLSTVSTGGDSVQGRQDLFRFGCGSCHIIPGVAGAHGQVGPSLEGVASQSYIAGQLANQPANLERWIQHPHAVHHDSVMPELGLTDAQSRDIAAYLYLLNKTH